MLDLSPLQQNSQPGPGEMREIIAILYVTFLNLKESPKEYHG